MTKCACIKTVKSVLMNFLGIRSTPPQERFHGTTERGVQQPHGSRQLCGEATLAGPPHLSTQTLNKHWARIGSSTGPQLAFL